MAYQTVRKGLTKVVKENKKLIWPSFPVKCGSFSLENFNHAIKESANMESLKLHTLLKRKFDVYKVAHNITNAVKLKPYNHEDNDFEDMLQSAKSFEQAFKWAKANLSLKIFERFCEFKNEMLAIIPLHLLRIEDKPTPSVTINIEGPTSCTTSQMNIEKTLDKRKAQETDNTTKSSRKSAEKQALITPPKEISLEIKGSSLEQEWDQFNQKLEDTPKMTDTKETMECQTPLHIQENTASKPMDKKSKPMDEHQSLWMNRQQHLSKMRLSLLYPHQRSS